MRSVRSAPGKRGCLFPLLLLIILLVTVRLFSTTILAAAGSLLIEDDGPRKADTIVVLGGDAYGDRTIKGADLAKAGYAPSVLVSGPVRLMGYESSDEIQFAEQRGYPAQLFREVRLPPEAESTRTEAQFVGKYLHGQGVKSILLVTSNFHTKRAAAIWRAENPNLTLAVVPSTDPELYFTPATWWKTRPGRKMFFLEWTKTISAKLGI
jgi:uncharacterized SAM-binding protein YcdF (DUF218 family)